MTKYIEDRVDGFDTLLQEVMSPSYSLDKVELVTGVKAEDIFAMARLIGTAERTAVYYSMEVLRNTPQGTITFARLLTCNSCVATSVLKVVVSTLYVVNPMFRGACDMGALPNNLPGYQKVYNPMVRQNLRWSGAFPICLLKRV